jgi:hypothetical protein
MNLAETQGTLKRGIFILAILIFTFYTGKFLIRQGINIYRSINPPELPAPESKFGALPQLKMTQATISGTPQYILDTKTGNLPAFPDRVKVYPYIEPQPTLLSEQKIKQLATDLQFTGASSKLTNSLFRWVDGTNTRTFQADAVSKNFKLETPPFRISNIVAGTTSITEQDAIASVQGFLKSKSLVPPADIENLTYKTIPTQVNLGQIRESKALTTAAKLLKVDAYIEIPGKKLRPNDPDVKYKVLGPNARDALISFTTTNSPNIAFKYPIANFTYWEPNYTEGSDYYLSPIQDVWAAVQSGKGIISYVRPKSGDYYVPIDNLKVNQINIRDVYLAYYMQSDYTPYLQPIYVFEGQISTTDSSGNPDTGDIVIYYPAVRGDFVAK